jgi:hypothetical protein
MMTFGGGGVNSLFLSFIMSIVVVFTSYVTIGTAQSVRAIIPLSLFLLYGVSILVTLISGWLYKRRHY